MDKSDSSLTLNDIITTAPITNVVCRRLREDQQYQMAVEKARGTLNLTHWVTDRSIGVYRQGYDVTRYEFLDFSSHGIWTILNNKMVPDFIKCPKEEFISKVEFIDSLRKQMNDLIPLILLEDEDACQRWHILKQTRLQKIAELAPLIDDTLE